MRVVKRVDLVGGLKGFDDLRGGSLLNMKNVDKEGEVLLRMSMWGKVFQV